MNEAQKCQHMQSLAQELTTSLEQLRDALTGLSLSLKDGQMHLNAEAAHTAERMAQAALRHCARPPLG